MARDLAVLLDTIGAGQVDLVGYSICGSDGLVAVRQQR